MGWHDEVMATLLHVLAHQVVGMGCGMGGSNGGTNNCLSSSRLVKRRSSRYQEQELHPTCTCSLVLGSEFRDGQG